MQRHDRLALDELANGYSTTAQLRQRCMVTAILATVGIEASSARNSRIVTAHLPQQAH